MDYRAAIQKYTKKWVPKLFLSDWIIKLEYDLHNKKKHKGNHEYDAITVVPFNSPEYMTAIIVFNVKKYRKHKHIHAQVEHTVLHELLHLSLAHVTFRVSGSDAHVLAEETLVQRMVQTLLNLEEGNA